MLNPVNIVLAIVGLSLLVNFILMVLRRRSLNRPHKFGLALEEGGAERLVIVKSGHWRNTQLWLDGALLATFPDENSLRQGQEVKLPDGSILRLKLDRQMFSYFALNLWRDGVPLPGFGVETNLKRKVLNANGAVMAVGILYFIVAFVSFIMLFLSHSLNFVTLIYSLFWGLVFLVLALLGQRWLPATFLGTLVFIMDGALGIGQFIDLGYSLFGTNLAEPLKYFSATVTLPFAIGFITFHILLLIPMIVGCVAGLRLQKYDSESAQKSSLWFAIILLLVAIGLCIYLFRPELIIQQRLQHLFNPTGNTPAQTKQSPLSPAEKTPGATGTVTNICWTYRLTGFSGNRADAWETVLSVETKTLLPFDRFKEEVLTYNSQLAGDGYVFSAGKEYLLPEPCP